MRELLERIPEFRTWHAAAKVAVWLTGVAMALGAVQLVGWYLPVDFDVTDPSGPGGVLVIAFAMAGLLIMMSSERRPLADFGMAVPTGWSSRLVIGIVAGVLSISGLLFLAWIFGAIRFGHSVRLGRFYYTFQALPVAMAISVIFPGYLLSMFRLSYGRVISIGATAVLFALLQRYEQYDQLLTAKELSMSLSLVLAAIVLCELRLLFGSVFVSGGVLAGWLAVRKFAKKTRLFEEGDSDHISWFASGLDVRPAPATWILLGVVAIVLGVILARRKEDTIIALDSSGAIDEKFKRMYPFANMGVLAPLDVWLVQLTRARWRVAPVYWARLVAILSMSAINTVLTLPERVLAPLVVRWRAVKPPIFVIGVHRSGTTHLQNLLALDQDSVCARTHHVLNPHGFLVTGWLLIPFIKAFSPWKRPMDAVSFGIFSPNEEEYAIANTSGLSPDWAVRLPREIERYERMTFPDTWSDRERRRWRRCMRLFVRKLALFGKRPLLKNPYNTARVGELAAMYPGAKFVHIHRDPYRVYRSNMHLAQEGHTFFQLQDPLPENNYASRFLENYRRMESAYYRDADALDGSQVIEVRYEDLDVNPEETIRGIYEHFGIGLSRRYEQRLTRYLDSVASYKKNTFTETPTEVADKIRATLEPLFARWERDPRTGQIVEAAREAVET